MGLDQYLYRRTFLSTGSYINEDQREAVVVTKGGQPHPQIKNSRIKYVLEEIAYWRKANHIHQWFVNNVQNGVDDCGTYKVESFQLETLLDICKEVIRDNSRADELLPTSSGFFFGSTEYDEHYFGDIQSTIDILEECLSESSEGFEYHSSW